MKRLTILLILLLCAASLFAQAPEKFSYQAVVRNANNALVSNASVTVRVSILQGSADGQALYVETHNAVTNANGLLTLEVGGGKVELGAFDGINWEQGPFFLKTETDPNGGNDYSVISTQQLLSVPYALYAKEAANSFSGDYNDLRNKPTIPQNVGELTNDAGYITMDDLPNPPKSGDSPKDAGTIQTDECGSVDLCSLVNLVDQLRSQMEDMQTALLPNVTTDSVIGYTETSAKCGGTVTVKGYNEVTERGVCWSTETSPTVEGNHTSDGTGPGTFTSTLMGLTQGTTYYVRAYATNSAGTAYGEEVIFTMEVEEDTCSTIEVPYSENFDSFTSSTAAATGVEPTCWKLVQEDVTIPTDKRPQVCYKSDYAHSGSYSLMLNYRGVYAMPALSSNISLNTLKLNMYLRQAKANYRLEVGVWEDDGTFTVVQTVNNATTDVEQVEVDFSNYEGNGHRIAFRNVLGSGTSPYSYNYLDDITLTEIPTAQCPPVSTLGDMETFENYTTNTTAATGMEPDCWELVQEDVTMPADKRPQICYKSEYAHSGDYSLMLNYRGIYAMPALSPDIALNTLKLNMYVRQAKANYRLEVGVWEDNGTFTAVQTVNNSTTGVEPVVVNFSGYTGSGHRIAFHNVLSSGSTAYSYNYLDDIVITPSGIELDEKSCPGAPTVTDHEGNIYSTVQIGDQCWMRENLRTTTSPSTGTYLIPTAETDLMTFTGKQARWYNNDSATYASLNYGLFYNWNAAADTFNTAYGETSVNTEANNVVLVSFTGYRRGICPAGWHLPSDAEWTALTDYVSSQNDYICSGNTDYIAKALASETGWNNDNGECYPGDQSVNANNASGFSAVPTGLGHGPYYHGAGIFASFWSSTQTYSGREFVRSILYDYANVDIDHDSKDYGYPVRCLRNSTSGGDATTATLPTVTTGQVSEITATSAICGGEVTADGGAEVTERGVCWSSEPNPTLDGSHTSDDNGAGEFTSTLTGLQPSTTYYVRAYATNNEGTSYGEEVSFATDSIPVPGAVVDEKSCPGTPTVTDHDGNVYATVQIGQQCWMRENLRVTHYAGGTTIPSGGDELSETNPYYYDDNDHSLPLEKRGYLYNWPAAMVACPVGWHLPSNMEWTQLTDYVSLQPEYICGGETGYIAKALASTEGWGEYYVTCTVGNDTSANNASGFAVVPSGRFENPPYGFGPLVYNSFDAFIWSSTKHSLDVAGGIIINHAEANVDQNSSALNHGCSVRCLRNEGNSEVPSVSTVSVTDITANQAIVTGSVTDDGGETVTQRGFVYDTLPYPSIYSTVRYHGSGVGQYANLLNGLTSGKTYYIRAFAQNNVGTAYGNQITFTTSVQMSETGDAIPCPGTPTLTDFDGNIYNTVQIGDQCWMRENLRVTHYADGTPIPAGEDEQSETEPYYYDFSSHSLPLEMRGYLYNWPAAMMACPAGWHLPSDTEWTQLTDYLSLLSEYPYTCNDLSSSIGKALASTEGWHISDNTCSVGNNPNANNATGFSAVPAGYCFNSSLSSENISASFWFSSPYSNSTSAGRGRSLNYNEAFLSTFIGDKFSGRSVRCLRD